MLNHGNISRLITIRNAGKQLKHLSFRDIFNLQKKHPMQRPQEFAEQGFHQVMSFAHKRLFLILRNIQTRIGSVNAIVTTVMSKA